MLGPVEVVVRPAGPADRPALVAVVQAAFCHGGRDGLEEVQIVQDTWRLDAAPAGLDLVAVDGSTVVGHVMAARGRLNDGPVLGVAPLSVAPDRHGQGIGTVLMETLLARVTADGWPLVLLLGHPAYYQRFGFEPAAAYGISYPPSGPTTRISWCGAWRPT